LWAAGSYAEQNDTLYRTIFGDGKVLFQVIEETQRTREVAPPPRTVAAEPYRGFGMARAVFGFRLGGFFVTDAYGEEPDPDASFGLLFRSPLGGYYRLGRIEIAFDTNIYKMRHDYSAPITDLYERYYEVTISYIGYIPGHDVTPNLYWGIGFGYGNNMMRAETATTTAEENWGSAVFVLRLGWDTLEGLFFEISQHWLLSDDTYIDSLFQIAIGLYF
ncbi:MAG: hypothetical protein N2234_03745, partial [Planctomycetota bacterium]|nr:hypothetical protein [Planctomycetota bacterium]